MRLTQKINSFRQDNIRYKNNELDLESACIISRNNEINKTCDHMINKLFKNSHSQVNILTGFNFWSRHDREYTKKSKNNLFCSNFHNFKEMNDTKSYLMKTKAIKYKNLLLKYSNSKKSEEANSYISFLLQRNFYIKKVKMNSPKYVVLNRNRKFKITMTIS